MKKKKKGCKKAMRVSEAKRTRLRLLRGKNLLEGSEPPANNSTVEPFSNSE